MSEEARRIWLSGGRSVQIKDEVVELLGPSGGLELRIKITPEGPVLQVEGVKVAIKAADQVAVECKTFAVAASEHVQIRSEGELDVTSQKEMKVTSTDDVRVVGKIIHLN